MNRRSTCVFAAGAFVAGSMMVLPATGHAAATPTGYHFGAPPIASAGSIGPGQSVQITLRVVNGSAPDPGGQVYLYYTHQHVTGDSTTVPASQCGGVSQVSLNPSSPTLCTANSSGIVQLTYTAPQQIPAQGRADFIAENTPSNPSVRGITHYVYCTVFRFSPSPVARSGSLAGGASVPVTVSADNGLNQPSANSQIYISFVPASGGGSASVGGTKLSGTPQLFHVGSDGTLQLTYTAPASPPASGQDVIRVQDLAHTAQEVNTDSYAFASGTPVVSVGDVAVVEGDQDPTIPAEFTLTVSPVQSKAVTVQYVTLCGIGDKGCPEDFIQVTSPSSVTIPAGSTNAVINVPQFAYIGAHAGETYEEGWFVEIENPSAGVVGRSIGTGLLHPDVEGTDTALPYLYVGDAAAVPTPDPGGIQLHFTVTLGAIEKSAVSFNYATSNGSATAGSDYTSTSGSASIAAGKTSVVISVTLLPNAPPGSDRTFSFTISGASGGLTIARPTGTGTVLSH